MARKTKTTLTFQVTIPQPQGVSITEVRNIIVDSIKEGWKDKVADPNFHIKCHLTNKETSYA